MRPLPGALLSALLLEAPALAAPAPADAPRPSGIEDDGGEEGGDAEEEEDDDEPVARAAPPKAPAAKVEWGKEPSSARPSAAPSPPAADLHHRRPGRQAGLQFWQARPEGRRRRPGPRQYIVGSDASGYQVRAGAFAGPWYKVIGARTGPDFFYSQYRFGPDTLDPSAGLSWPVIGLLDFKVINFHAGVEPAFFFNPDYPTVDWSAEERFGFGGEFTYRAGVGLDLKAAGITLGYTDRITAFGRDQGFGVGFRVGG